MAIGDLTEDLPVQGEDELGELTAAFNLMRSSIFEAEQALKHRDEESRNVIESSPSGMIMTDEQGVILMLNQQAAVLFGYQNDELLGQKIEILVPADVRGHHHKLPDGFMAHPEARPMGIGQQLRGLRKDGGRIPIEIGLNPIQTGQDTRVLAGIIDLTERKRVEEELAKETAEEASRGLGPFFRVSLDMLCIAGTDGFFKRVNPAFSDTLGYPEDELLGQPFIDFVHPDDQA